MVAITGYPFDSGAGAAVQEGEWSRMAQHFRTTGVIPGILNDFEVYGDSTGMQVKVKTGQAIIKGNLAGNLTSEQTLSITAADPTLNRIDRVILQVDWTNNEITLEVKTGSAAASPTAPSLTQTEFTVWEFTLAQVYVGAGVSTITAGNVTDERVFSRGNNDAPRLGDRQAVTVSSGAITVEAEKGFAYYKVTGEGGSADTINTINLSSPQDGCLLVLVGQASYNIALAEGDNIRVGNALAQVTFKNTNPVMLTYDATDALWYIVGVEYAGKKSFWIPGIAFSPSSPSTQTTELINTVHPCLEFPDAALTYGYTNLEMPADYDGGNFTAYIWWIAGVTGTNSVVWRLAVDMLADGEAYAAYDDTQDVTDAAQNSTSIVLRTAAVTLSPTWAASDLAVLRVGRQGTDGSDTLAGDAWLIGVKIEYNTNKPTQG